MSNDTMLHYYRKSLLSLFREVQKVRRDPKKYRHLCLSIQETLISRLTYVERRIRTLKIDVKSYQKDLRTRRLSSSAKETSIGLKERIKIVQSRIGQYQELLFIFRSIGDALAFIYIDRWDIKPMSCKQPSGFISWKKGTRLERKCLRGAFQVGGLALLNDLTHCLRYGDITIPKDGFFQVLEIKSGRCRSTRETRQANALKSIYEYVVTDRTDKLYGLEGEMVRTSIHSDATYYTNEINSLINDAVRDGVAFSEVEKGLIYFVATRFEKDLLDRGIHLCRKTPIIGHLNQMKFLEMGGYYPVTLSIRDSEALYNFYHGGLNILIAVDPGTIEDVAEQRGYNVQFIEDSDNAIAITPNGLAANGPKAMLVSRHFLGRVFSEFLSLRWLLDELIYQFESKPLKEGEPHCA